jgi:hypothetical protein
MKSAPNKAFQRILKTRHLVDPVSKTAELGRWAAKMIIPENISKKLSDNEKQAIEIINNAEESITDFSTDNISLTYQISAPVPELTPDERACSMVFIFRYDHLPDIHEYRTIFWNQRDPIYFGKISTIYRAKLVNRDPSKGLSITARNEKGHDVTMDFVGHLDSRNKAIRKIIQQSDFNYIFNGVLQHSDGKFSTQLIKDYTNGNLNYILLKNMTLARHIKLLFREYYKVINVLSFPRMGCL